MMTTQDRIKSIELCIQHKAALEAAIKPLEQSLGPIVDGPLWNSVWAMFDDVTKLTEREIGDSFGWVSWFVWDNDCGNKRLEAKASAWKARRKIRTVKDLVKLIEADL
jgi:hypothetical protein